jgi:hypothetical protein
MAGEHRLQTPVRLTYLSSFNIALFYYCHIQRYVSVSVGSALFIVMANTFPVKASNDMRFYTGVTLLRRTGIEVGEMHKH